MEVHVIAFEHLQMLCKKVKTSLSMHVHARIAMSHNLSTYPLSLAMTTSVRLVCHQVKVGALVPSMLMIPCGMVKVVVQLVHATHSTIHHGFVNNYLSQLMLIWKSDSACLILQILKRFR